MEVSIQNIKLVDKIKPLEIHLVGSFATHSISVCYYNKSFYRIINIFTCKSYPWRHLVRVSISVVIVEDQNGRHDGRGHHEHDTVEICTCWVRDGVRQGNTLLTQVNMRIMHTSVMLECEKNYRAGK